MIMLLVPRQDVYEILQGAPFLYQNSKDESYHFLRWQESFHLEKRLTNEGLLFPHSNPVFYHESWNSRSEYGRLPRPRQFFCRQASMPAIQLRFGIRAEL